LNYLVTVKNELGELVTSKKTMNIEKAYEIMERFLKKYSNKQYIVEIVG
jgi:hypothetical protein